MPTATTTSARMRVLTIARERFGWDGLRTGQLDAVVGLLEGHDTMVVMPTGAGKSAVYQLAALLLDGPTVVVSPLIALQRDQLVSLLGVEGGAARSIDSQRSRSEVESTYAALAAGEVEFLFLTPEQLQKPDVIEQLRAARPSLIVVDEAHCVSAWGHDFRPEYLRLGAVVQRLGHPTVVALTATASPPVRDEIVASLGLRDPRLVVHGFDRPNLDLQVQRYLDDDEKREAVVLRAAGEAKPGLVYAATRKDAERYAEELSAIGLRVGAYHSGLPAGERQRVHDAFLAGELDVVTATTAFGMGIDKPDVRFVLHAQVADSPDGYYQEIGRAGRDGEPAVAVLFYREEDLGLRRYFAAGVPKEQDLRRVVTLVGMHDGPVPMTALREASGFGSTKLAGLVNLLEQVGAVVPSADGALAVVDGVDPGEAAGSALVAAENRQRMQRSRVDMMRGYAETTGCRREYLLAYFGEAYDAPCGACDNCRAGWAAVTEGAAEGEASYPLNARVRHDSWGEGVVMSHDGDQVTVLFDTVGYKTLLVPAVEQTGLLVRA